MTVHDVVFALASVCILLPSYVEMFEDINIQHFTNTLSPDNREFEKSLEIDITVGDTVWYRGEKWQVSLHDYWSDGNATVTHKFYLRNDLRGVANAELFEIKKVIRTNSCTDHVN